MMAWKVKKLGEVLEVLRNGINCKQNKKGNGEKITRIETIAFAKINIDKVGFGSLNENEKQKYRLKKGDILFSHINSPPHVGKTALFDSNDELYHGVNLLLMKPKSFMLSEYLEYFLKYLYRCGYWKKECKQSVNQASVNQQDIKKILIKYPHSLLKQKQIVSLLDEAFEKIEKAKENSEQNLKNAKEVFESYLQNVFENKGEGWEVKPLNKIGNIFSGNSINAKIKKEKFQNINLGMPYVATKDVSYESVINYDNGIKIPDNELDNFRIAHKNSIFICAEGGSAGRKLAFNTRDVCFVNKLFALEPLNFMEPKYIFYFYHTSDFQEQFKSKITGLIGGVSMGKFKKIEIPFPSLPIQKQMVSKFDAFSQKTKKLETIYNQKLSSLEELKQSILKKAFKGELVGAAA
jgi:type I restriction enzyme, S subunit